MSRNGSGTYSPVVTGGAYPAVSGTLIEANKFNTQITDIATALTESLAKDGQTTPTADLPMGNFKLTGLGNGTTRGSSVNLGQVQDSTMHWGGTAGGTANALTLTLTPAITAYAAGQTFRFKSGASANTGAATINVSGVGAIAIQRNGNALKGGEIQANSWYEIVLSDASTAQLKKIGRYNGIAFNGAGFGLSSSQAVSRLNKDQWHEIQAAGLTITLPPLADCHTGDTFVFLSPTNDWTLKGDGSENIQSGSASNTKAILAGEYIFVTSNETAWYITMRGSENITPASQAEMETPSSNSVMVTPSNLKWHPGIPKVWLKCNTAGTIAASHNVTSITDNGPGDLTVTIATDFSSIGYVVNATSNHSSASMLVVLNQAGGSFDVRAFSDAGAAADPSNYGISAFGDQ